MNARQITTSPNDQFCEALKNKSRRMEMQRKMSVFGTHSLRGTACHFFPQKDASSCLSPAIRYFFPVNQSSGRKFISWLAYVVTAATIVSSNSAELSYDAIRARVEEWQPKASEKVFDQIGWAEDIRAGLQLAKEHERPLFLFTHDGRMNLGRC
jgi:hypothetical protein